MKRGESTRLTIVSTHKKFSYFLEWQFFTMIQSDQQIMYFLNNELTIRNLSWTTPNSLVSFRSYLTQTSKHLIETNISRVQEELKNTTVLAQADNIPNYPGLNMSRKTFMDFSTFFSLITTIITVLAVTTLCCYSL